MTANITSKAMALAGISALLAGSIAVVNTLSQGVLFETKKAGAAEKTAVAANIQAENTLRAAIEQAKAIIAAAQNAAQATTEAAKVQAAGLVAATQVSMHPESSMYDGVTDPMFAGPMKKIAKLNEELAQVNWEILRGLDHETRRPLSDEEVFKKANRKMVLEEELALIDASTSKSWNDSLNILVKSMGKGFLGGGEYTAAGPAGFTAAPLRKTLQAEP